METNVFTFIIFSQNILSKILEKTPHKKKIAQFVSKKIEKELSNFLNIEESCTPHVHFLINHLITCKLFRNFNWYSKNLKQVRSEKSKTKLKILRNV